MASLLPPFLPPLPFAFSFLSCLLYPILRTTPSKSDALTKPSLPPSLPPFLPSTDIEEAQSAPQRPRSNSASQALAEHRANISTGTSGSSYHQPKGSPVKGEGK